MKRRIIIFCIILLTVSQGMATTNTLAKEIRRGIGYSRLREPLSELLEMATCEADIEEMTNRVDYVSDMYHVSTRVHSGFMVWHDNRSHTRKTNVKRMINNVYSIVFSKTYWILDIPKTSYDNKRLHYCLENMKDKHDKINKVK